MKKQLVVLAGILGLLPLPALAGKKELWVYTSIYKQYATPIEEAFEKKHPEIDVQIFQAGSEKLQAKVEAEILAKRTQADIVLSSDPFWSFDLDQRGLVQHPPDGEPVATNYFSMMVMIAHKDLPAAKRPKSFKDLTQPQFKGLVQAGSPMESGTAFSTVAYLSRKYGWEYFNALRANQLASSGGNSTVIQKVESGEKKIGIVLLENAMAALERKSPIEIIYPSDGGVPIPSVQLVLKDSPNPKEARMFADFILSKEGQELLRNGYMYSVRKDVGAPTGAKPMSQVSAKPMPWNRQVFLDVGAQAKEIKKKYSDLILN